MKGRIVAPAAAQLFVRRSRASWFLMMRSCCLDCFGSPHGPMTLTLARQEMTRAALSKREIRERSAQLRALICEWDPIGVMSDPAWPRDEYDCLVGPLLTLVQSSASAEEIAHFLRTEIVEHFGLSGEGYDFTAVAERVRRWFDREWRDLVEPVTIFVALIDEGVDVWRPVQARPLDHGLFRIVGVDTDTSDETWQFATGAIVRCEQKRFADGTCGLTAVEQAEDAG